MKGYGCILTLSQGKVLKASSWRVELTALSRTQNLYFVASRPGATVHVYQPRYINQTLGRPVLCLRHQPSSEGLRGYINPNDPHSINRLHIDYLGRKEILLTASDDGDIVGYYISGIMAAIETLESGENTEGFPDVKPFFRINVEKSAWGLAVHRQARLIAISANSHKVTVVAFKLATGAIKNPYYVSDRRTGYSVRTLQAGDNVPSISFNNTGTDPSGRWLVGNVIDGSTGLWDLHRDERRTLFLGHCILTPKGNDNSQHPHCETYSHSTWGAIFVDPRWCHFSKSKREAFGGRPRWRDDNIWDTTVSVLQEESGSVNHLFAEPWKYINHGMYPYFMSSNNSDVDESSVVPIHNQHKLCTAGNYGDGEDNFFDVIRNTENVRVPIMPSQFVSNPNGFYANPTLNASPTSIPDDINTEGSNGNVSDQQCPYWQPYITLPSFLAWGL